MVATLPLTGSQVFQFGYLRPDNSREINILPSQSHFNCTSTTILTQSFKVCVRLDATTRCTAGPLYQTSCTTSVDCAGYACDVLPASGQANCSSGASAPLDGYNGLVQIDHNTNQNTLGFPQDSGCTNTYVNSDGSVGESCMEGLGAGCPGSTNVHLGVCNSPVVRTFSGAYPAGGFRVKETLNLTWCRERPVARPAASAALPPASAARTRAAPAAPPPTVWVVARVRRTTAPRARAAPTARFSNMITQGVCGVCPPDSCPLQSGEFQIPAELTSGSTTGVMWNLNNTTAIMGTTGAGNGANVCGSVSGGPACPTKFTGQAFPNCNAAVPSQAQMSNVAAAVPHPFPDPPIDVLPGVPLSDFLAGIKLQCQ